MVGGSSRPFPALSLSGRAVLERRIELDDSGPVGVPKRQAGGLKCGVRIVVTYDNTDNSDTNPRAAAPQVRVVLAYV
jgi:hypothetical protein